MSWRGQLQRLRRLAWSALESYGLPVYSLTPLRHEANTTFRLTAGNGSRYVLRIHPPGSRTVEAIRSEMLWLAALRRDTDLQVPEPNPTRDGSLLVLAEGEGVPEPRVCVLFRWLEGRFLDDRLTPAHLARVGILTARLQEHAAQWQPPDGFVRGRVDNLTAAARASSRYDPSSTSASDLAPRPSEHDAEQLIRLATDLHSVEDGRTVRTAIDRVRQVLNELGYGPEVFGLIHGDLHQENYCFHRGEVRAIDFDDCGYGHYLFDLNVTLIEVQHLPRYPALREALLAGYRQIRPLPHAHEGYLDTFFALRRLQLLAWVLDSREHPAFRDEWFEWSRDLLNGIGPFLDSK